jgi:hypothetical protein
MMWRRLFRAKALHLKSNFHVDNPQFPGIWACGYVCTPGLQGLLTLWAKFDVLELGKVVYERFQRWLPRGHPY